ncbi:hypothetical protein FOA52_006911 [Chlamydomonas sp. UWO 241]|nr:hypothetical protein FOA52_006911 [Chlamydomonas sp. UWO 241]
MESELQSPKGGLMRPQSSRASLRSARSELPGAPMSREQSSSGFLCSDAGTQGLRPQSSMASLHSARSARGEAPGALSREQSGFLRASSNTAGPAGPVLRTSKSLNMRPLSPPMRKPTAELRCTSARMAPPRMAPPRPGTALGNLELQPRRARPATAPVSRPIAWQSSAPLTMPNVLRFETWWFEAGARVTMHLSYSTATCACTASLEGLLGRSVIDVTGAVLDEPWDTCGAMTPWDLHVGATLVMLGRTVTLRKASDAATLNWLDRQAAELLREKLAIERELEKFRQVGDAPVQFRPLRCEPWDLATHSHMPRGGRLSLAALRHRVGALLTALRQHTRVLPTLRSPAMHGLAEFAEGPDMWRVDAAPESAESSSSQLPGPATPKRRPTSFGLDRLLEVPLAASAAGLGARSAAAAAAAAKERSKGMQPSPPRTPPRASPAAAAAAAPPPRAPAGAAAASAAGGGAAGPRAAAGVTRVASRVSRALATATAAPSAGAAPPEPPAEASGSARAGGGGAGGARAGGRAVGGRAVPALGAGAGIALVPGSGVRADGSVLGLGDDLEEGGAEDEEGEGPAEEAEGDGAEEGGEAVGTEEGGGRGEVAYSEEG